MPNLVVDAGPGSAKTYTACRIPGYLRATNKTIFLQKNQHTEEQLAIWKWAAENIMPHYQNSPPKFLYAAYNADIVPEVRPQVPDPKGKFGVDVRTIHGAGYKAINSRYGFLRLNNNRGTHIVEGLTGQNFYKLKDRFKWLSCLRFIEKLKEELMAPTPENFVKLKEKYDGLANMAIYDSIYEDAKVIMKKMQIIDRAIGIEYIDQLWLPLFFQKTPIYDVGIIDECQDLSPAKLLLVRKLCKNLIFVGDPNQAINAFAGADPHAFERIREVCSSELPLRTSFRNPRNIIHSANQIILNPVLGDPRKPIKGTKDYDGEERRITLETLTNNLPEKLSDALIICRYNAPLIACALKLYKEKIPCAISGKQLPEELCRIVKQRKAYDLDDLEAKLQTYEDFTCSNVKPHIQEVIKDKIDCIRLVLPICDTIDDVEAQLKDMFKVRKNQDHVQLSTIHKSKGKERPHIYILFPPIESEYASTPEQLQQERNLHFVAITRTSQNLYWINRE